jgi:hypothetical protein
MAKKTPPKDLTDSPAKGRIRIVVKQTIKKPKVSHENQKHRAESVIRPPNVLERTTPPDDYKGEERTPSLAAKEWERIDIPRDPLLTRLMRHRETGERVAVIPHPYDDTERLYVSLGIVGKGQEEKRVTPAERRLVLDVASDLLEVEEAEREEIREEAEGDLPHYTMRQRHRGQVWAEGQAESLSQAKPVAIVEKEKARLREIGERREALAEGGVAEEAEDREREEGESPPQAEDSPDTDGTSVDSQTMGSVSSRSGGDSDTDGKSVTPPTMARRPSDFGVSNAANVPGAPEPSGGGGGQGVKLSITRRRALPVFTSSGVTDAEVRKMGRTPGLMCSNCAIGTECPEYQPSYVCAYNEQFKAFPSRDQETVIAGMKYIVDKNRERLFRAYHYEEAVNGGQLDIQVTRQSDMVLSQAHQLLEMERESVRAELELPGEGGERAPGILSRLFGGGNQPSVPTSGIPQSLPVPSPSLRRAVAEAQAPIRATVGRERGDLPVSNTQAAEDRGEGEAESNRGKEILDIGEELDLT